MAGSVKHETGIGSKLRSTMHIANKEHERVERFKSVREKAVEIAVDAQSRHIVREFKDKQR
jgi:hypothetical protein